MDQKQKEQDVEARREARRRKILENAKNRLGKIAGREINDSELPADIRETSKTVTPPEAAPEKIIYPDPDIERDVYERPAFQNTLAEPNPFENQEFFELLTSLQQGGPNGGFPPNGFPGGLPNGFPGGLPNGFPGGLPGGLPPGLFDPAGGLFGPPPPQTPKIPDTTFTKFLKSKMHIGLLAMLTYFFIGIGHSCNVFLIFLVWEMVEMFILKQYENKSGSLLSIVFMFSGISPAKLNVFLKWFQITNRVLRDVAIFIFFFVVSHICYGSRYEPTTSAPIVENRVADSFADEFGMEF